MPRKLAIAVIHGMGRQKKADPGNTAQRTFSAGLYAALEGRLGAGAVQRLAWHEIFWADIMEARQRSYLGAVGSAISQGPLRQFVIRSLGDAAGYRKTPPGSYNTTYQDTHARVARCLENLEAEAGPQAPLLFIAHSLGGHVISNYIWDLQHGATAPTDFQRCEQVAGIVTFGCNIPVFLFSHPYERIEVIRRPSQRLDPASGSIPGGSTTTTGRTFWAIRSAPRARAMPIFFRTESWPTSRSMSAGRSPSGTLSRTMPTGPAGSS